MNNKGFVLIKNLMGLVLLAIITVTCLPILNTSLNNFILAKERTNMIFLAESIIEEIKSFDYDSPYEEEYLFDIKVIDLINKFNNEIPVIIKLPLDIENEDFKYGCTIYKENNFENLWKIQVEIFLLQERGKINDVKIITFIPKP